MIRDRFIVAQIHAMDKAIYIASEQARKNLRFDNQGHHTDVFFIDWIQNHAFKFCQAWNVSLCRNCRHVTQCYDCLKEDCAKFEKTDDYQEEQIESLTLKETKSIWPRLRTFLFKLK